MQELVRSSFGCLEEVIGNAEEKGTSRELAAALLQFAAHHSITEPLLQWLVKREIDKTTFYSSVFREDCFAVQVLNEMLYSEKGTIFLKKLITPIVQRVTEIYQKDKRTLQLLPNIPSRIFDANVADTLKIVDHFLSVFSFSIYGCPGPLRQAFAIIQATIETRFAEEITAETSPVGLDLIFFKFICPAIISADKYDTPSKLKTEIQPSLIAISKILNDLALNNPNRSDARIAAYIAEKHPLLRSLFFTFIDRTSIDTVDTKGEISIMSPVCRDRSAEKIREIVRGQFETSVTDSAYELCSRLGVRKCEQFMRKLENDDWLPFKRYPEISMFKLKEGEESLCVKAHILMRAPLPFVLKCFLEFGQPMNRVTRTFIREPTDNFKLERIVAKMPFPLTDRECAISTWVSRSKNPDRAFFVTDDASQFMVPQKGLVRAKVHLSGAMMQSDADGNTMMIRMAHGDINGSAPRWLVDLLNVEQAKRWRTFKKKVEKRYARDGRMSMSAINQASSTESSASCESL